MIDKVSAGGGHFWKLKLKLSDRRTSRAHKSCPSWWIYRYGTGQKRIEHARRDGKLGAPLAQVWMKQIGISKYGSRSNGLIERTGKVKHALRIRHGWHVPRANALVTCISTVKHAIHVRHRRHDAMDWLNALALLSMACIVVTGDVSHNPIGWLNRSALRNMRSIVRHRR